MAKKRKVLHAGSVWHQTSEEATLAKMPKYNGYVCGSGIHGDVKYNRSAQKRKFRKELDAGSFLFLRYEGFPAIRLRVFLPFRKYARKTSSKQRRYYGFILLS